MTSITTEVVQGGRGQAPGRRAVQELLRPRPGQLALHPADRAHPGLDHRAVRRQAAWCVEANTPRLQGRAATSARRPSFSSPHYEVKPADRSSRASTPTSPATPALAWGLVAAVAPGRAAALPRQLPDHPGLGHPPRAVQAQAVRGPHVPGRGRDRRHRRRPRRLLRRGPRGDDHQRARARPEVRGDRPGHQPRAAPAHHRRPAGRPLDRAAHQDRAGRPAPRHVRPPRRGAAARSWRPRRRATASRPRDRGGPASPSSTGRPVILLSDGYLANGAEPWRLPDLDDLPDHRPGLRHRAEPRR